MSSSAVKRRALISVFDKTGIEAFARGLAELGFELVSSGGTASFLEEQGLAVTRVEDVTQAPEMLGGRVKTLHPRIHAGILARLDLEEDRAALAEQGIEPFEVVCVNLYPFAAAAADETKSSADVIEMIDVGGPSMIRAAAKNHAYVAVVADPARYEQVLAELAAGGASAELRRELAGEAFAQTAAYDAAIADWFGRTETFPAELTIGLSKVADLSYGENPHQAAAYYRESGSRPHLLSNVEQLGGKALSYNNLGDLEGARRIAREFDEPAVVIVKHANPCGVAVAPTVEHAYARALAADPVSAFGCVLIVNRAVSDELGTTIAQHFVEVIMAPAYTDGALEALKAKEALRILLNLEQRPDTPGELDLKRVLGGLLVQERDADPVDESAFELVAGEMTAEQRADLLFAWRVCRHVSSNAIVLARDGQTIGIGAGQMSRVDAVRIAVEKARELGHDPAGSVLASDAFFPFADGPQLALDAGITAIIQPGGSKRDADTVEAVNAAGAAMLLSGRRHFRH